MTIDLTGKTASILAAQLASGDLTSEELVKSCLSAIAALGDPAIFITLMGDTALTAARASDARRRAGRPLSAWDGIPVAWKDLVDIPGTSTTAGSAVYKDATPPAKAAKIYDNCEKAGLICIGKTNLSEFAYSGLGLNPHYGTPVNPHSGHVDLAPGGSSAGSAVAVAANLVPLAVGTDTAGSVRVPASFCGISGYKSSQSHYDKTGIAPLSTSLDSVGTFAHSVDDIIQFDAILRDVDLPPRPDTYAEHPNIVIPKDIVMEGLDTEVLASFDQLLGRLDAAGYKIEHRAFPIFTVVAELFAKHGTLTVAEAATIHKDLLASEDANAMDRRVLDRIKTASQFSAQDYIQLQWERTRLEGEVSSSLGSDLLLFPTVPITAPPIAELDADDELFVRTNLLALRNTMLGNYLGMPGVNLTIGNTKSGSPIGALFSMATGMDLALLRHCDEIERQIG